jgi:hypothetical protein
MGLVRRFMAAVASLLIVLVVAAPAAGAHTISGVGATNFVTTLGGLQPAVPGVELKVIEAGSRLELTNHTATDVIVTGYSDEPYLRVGPGGVFVNTRSPATYLNATRAATSPVPPDADPTAAPVWKRIEDGQVARWHDHRTHWMGGRLPPQVRQQPDQRQTVLPWTIGFRQGDQPFAAQGALDWVPGPSPAPWIALALAAGVVAAAVGWLARGLRPRHLAVVAGVLVVAMVADVVHAAGLYAVVAGPWTTKLSRALSSNVFSIGAWVVGAGAVVLLLRRRAIGRYPALAAALVIGVAGGLFDVAYLSRTTLPFGLTANLGRAVVALTSGLGLGLAVGLLAGLTLPTLTLAGAASGSAEWPIGSATSEPPAGGAAPQRAGGPTPAGKRTAETTPRKAPEADVPESAAPTASSPAPRDAGA